MGDDTETWPTRDYLRIIHGVFCLAAGSGTVRAKLRDCQVLCVKEFGEIGPCLDETAMEPFLNIVHHLLQQSSDELKEGIAELRKIVFSWKTDHTNESVRKLVADFCDKENIRKN